MAGWTSEIDFENPPYSTGGLVGQDSWTAGTNDATVTTAQAAQGTQSASYQVTGNLSVHRDVTDMNTDGSIMYWSMRSTSMATVDNGCITLHGNNGATFYGIFALNEGAGGNGKAYWRNGSDNQLFTGLVANTWYRFGSDWDFTNDRVRFNVDNGSFGSYFSFAAVGAEVDRLYLQANTADSVNPTYYWDWFSASYAGASGPANLESLDTNVKANIKSYNTNVLGNIKSIDTNA